MKTNYLKSFIIFALGSVCTVGADNLADSSQKTSHQEYTHFESTELAQDETNPDSVRQVEFRDSIWNAYCELSIDSGNLVPLDEARFFVDASNLWQRMVPRQFTLSGNTILFDPVNVSNDDAMVIKYFADQYNRSNVNRAHSGYHDLPFSTENSLAQSYYIPRADVDALFCAYTEAQGIRAHLALTTIHFEDPAKTSSHIYLAPALDSIHDIVDGVTHVYDLTMPCPNTCPPKPGMFEGR